LNSYEIDGMVDRILQYRDAIKNGNEEKLWALLHEGTEQKIMIDG
jgi:hypothetical protein